MRLKNGALVAGVALWLAATGIGTVWLVDFASRPGIQAIGPKEIPADTFSDRDLNFPTLAVFVHPHCSCSRATLKELARLVSRSEESINVYVLFYRPAGKSREWVETDLWELTLRMPNVREIIVNKKVLTRFGAMTSGHAILYDRKGSNIFTGGITNARAHEGDNLGKSVILSYLANGEIPVQNAPVFGCALTSEHVSMRN